ncbi:hypothetical protein ACWEN6_35520 [Sphaerisporangium sp. NPDC004334]
MGFRGVKRSTVIYLSLGLLLVWGIADVWLTQLSDGAARHVRLVMGNAYQVAYPEYRILLWGSDAYQRTPTSVSLEVEVQQHALDNLRSYVTLSQNILGRVTASPEFPPSRMHPLLAGFRGGQGQDLGVKKAARALVESLGSGVTATVIVEFARPLSENGVVRLVPLRSADLRSFFLSPIQKSNRKPVFWRSGWDRCHDRGLDGCDESSAIAQFRQWCSMLEEGDRDDLGKIGLDLDVLRRTAEEGKVYGLVLPGAGRESALQLLSSPLVRTVDIVDLAPRSNARVS